MKKWFLLLTCCFYNVAFASPIQERTIDPVALSKLASRLGIPSNRDIVIEIQKRWLRKAGQERWEIAELPIDQRLFVLNWATEQGLFASWKPLCKTYDKALILGATTSRMQMRLDYLKQLWDEGTRFSEIVWLTGERLLDTQVDNLTDRCRTESEAAHILWEETALPHEMRSLPVIFIAAPMKSDGVSLKRPNTQDTIVSWLTTAPQPCKVLFVSNQPFCGYQFAVVNACLPEQFQFDVVGPGTDPTNQSAIAAITLDTIARWLYQSSIKKDYRGLCKTRKRWSFESFSIVTKKHKIRKMRYNL